VGNLSQRDRNINRSDFEKKFTCYTDRLKLAATHHGSKGLWVISPRGTEISTVAILKKIEINTFHV